MLIKLNSRLRRDVESGSTLAETVVAVAIIVLCLTLAGLALAASLQTSNQSGDLNKAYQLINKQFAIAKQVSYDKLGLVTSEAQAQVSLVQGTLTKSPCDDTLVDCNSKYGSNNWQKVYNRQLLPYTSDSPGAGQTDTRSAAITWCGASATNPVFTPSTNYNGEKRVVIATSNAARSGNSDSETDPSSNYSGDPNASPQSPLYCAWYQYGQGNGDPMFLNRSTNNPAGGVGTMFTVETNVTWVDSGAYDGVNSNAANCYTGTTNCFMAKRVTVTVRWINTDSSGKSHLQYATSSFVRAPNLAACSPVGDGNFAPVPVEPVPNPSATSAQAGVSCDPS